MKRINREVYLQCIQEMDQAKYNGNKPNKQSIINSQQLGLAKQQEQRGLFSGIVSAAMEKKQEMKQQAQDLAALAKLKADEAHAELQQAVETEKAAVQDALKS